MTAKHPEHIRSAVLQDLQQAQLIYSQIARKHNVSTSYVGQVASDNNIKRTLRPYLINWKPIRALYEEGHSLSHIERISNIPRKTITRFLKAQGYNIRHNQRRIPPVTLVRLRDLKLLTWPQIAQQLQNRVEPATLRRQYIKFKLQHNQTPLLLVPTSFSRKHRKRRCKPSTSKSPSPGTAPTASSITTQNP